MTYKFGDKVRGIEISYRDLIEGTLVHSNHTRDNEECIQTEKGARLFVHKPSVTLVSSRYIYDYFRPMVTASVVLVGVVSRSLYDVTNPSVLLIERGKDPFKGQLALPGGFVNENETTVQAAVRELREETGIHLRESELSLVGVFDAPGRDPRGHVIDVVFGSVIVGYKNVRLEKENTDDARNPDWVSINLVNEQEIYGKKLAFDHSESLTVALGKFYGVQNVSS